LINQPLAQRRLVAVMLYCVIEIHERCITLMSMGCISGVSDDWAVEII